MRAMRRYAAFAGYQAYDWIRLKAVPRLRLVDGLLSARSEHWCDVEADAQRLT